MDAQIRDKARSSPAVGHLRALWTHFASAPFSAPVADFRGGNYAAHYQAVTAAQRQGPGGVGSVGYMEVAGHELLFDLWGLNCLRGKEVGREVRIGLSGCRFM